MSKYDNLTLEHDVMNQLPVCIAWKDRQSIFIGGNQCCAWYCGLKSPLELEGLPGDKVKAPFAEHNNEFMRQDRIVLEENRQLDALGVYLCNNGIKVVLTQRAPLKQKGKVIGVFYQATVLSEGIIATFANNLLNIDDRYDSFSHSMQRSYICDRGYTSGEGGCFTRRENECLFLVLRGLPLPKIAKVLNISHRTVEKHVENIKIKMGVHFKSQLIEKAIKGGYLYSIPWSLAETNKIIAIHEACK